MNSEELIKEEIFKRNSKLSFAAYGLSLLLAFLMIYLLVQQDFSFAIMSFGFSLASLRMGLGLKHWYDHPQANKKTAKRALWIFILVGITWIVFSFISGQILQISAFIFIFLLLAVDLYDYFKEIKKDSI